MRFLQICFALLEVSMNNTAHIISIILLMFHWIGDGNYSSWKSMNYNFSHLLQIEINWCILFGTCGLNSRLILVIIFRVCRSQIKVLSDSDLMITLILATYSNFLLCPHDIYGLSLGDRKHVRVNKVSLSSYNFIVPERL